MKKQLLNRTCYLRWVVLLIIGVQTIKTQAQIIYTDISPDFASETVGDFYNLDLNNDGTVDYRLASISSSELIESNANGLNGVAAVGGPFDPYILPLDENTVVADRYYDVYGYLVLGLCNYSTYYCSYDWEGAMDKYLGLRVSINGQTHYGWARMDVTSATHWVIKDYAYNAKPNMPILAGQIVLGLEESILNELKIIVINGQVSAVNLQNRTEFNLYTINGQKILHGDLDKINNTINVQNLASGLYIIEL